MGQPTLFLLLDVLATSMSGLLFLGDDQYCPLGSMLNERGSEEKFGTGIGNSNCRIRHL